MANHPSRGSLEGDFSGLNLETSGTRKPAPAKKVAANTHSAEHSSHHQSIGHIQPAHVGWSESPHPPHVHVLGHPLALEGGNNTFRPHHHAHNLRPIYPHPQNLTGNHFPNTVSYRHPAPATPGVIPPTPGYGLADGDGPGLDNGYAHTRQRFTPQTGGSAVGKSLPAPIEQNYHETMKLMELVHPTEVLQKNGYSLRQLNVQELDGKKRCDKCLKNPKFEETKRLQRLERQAHRMSQVGQKKPVVGEKPEQGQGQQEQKYENKKERWECKFHTGILKGKFWTCCRAFGGQYMPHNPCSGSHSHTVRIYAPGELESLYQIYPTPFNPQPFAAVAIDCEMGTAASGDSELIRVTMIDYFTGRILIDSLVYPTVPMSHLNTKYSGVSFQDLNAARRNGHVIHGTQAAREAVWRFVGPETVIIGHSASNDLKALKWMHGNVIDTYILEPETKREIEVREQAKVKREMEAKKKLEDKAKLVEESNAERDEAKKSLPEKIKGKIERSRSSSPPRATKSGMATATRHERHNYPTAVATQHDAMSTVYESTLPSVAASASTGATKSDPTAPIAAVAPAVAAPAEANASGSAEIKSDQVDKPKEPEKRKPKPKGSGLRSLKTLASVKLNRDIQTGHGHDSLEDALASRDLAHWAVLYGKKGVEQILEEREAKKNGKEAGGGQGEVAGDDEADNEDGRVKLAGWGKQLKGLEMSPEGTESHLT